MSNVTSFRFLVFFVFSLALPAFAVQQSTFMPDDVFDVATLRVSDLSPDGQWVAVTSMTLRDRLGLDSHRYGDPTYVAPATGRLWVVNTSTADRVDVYGRNTHVVASAWNDEGNQLAIVTYADRDFDLEIYNRTTGNLRSVNVPNGTRIAGEQGPDIVWTGPQTLLIPIRPSRWLEDSQAEFRRLTDGPITVYSGDDPFLAWEALRRRGAVASVVELDVNTGSLREVLASTMLGRAGFHVVDNMLVYQADVAEKTSYDVIFGASTEFRVMSLDDGATKTVLDVPEARRVQWSAGGGHYAYAEKGSVYVGSIGMDEPTKLLGPDDDELDEDDEETEDDSTDRFSLQAISPNGRAIVASSDEGLFYVDVESGDRTLIVAKPDDDEDAPRRTVIGFDSSERQVFLQFASRTEWQRGVDVWTPSSGLRSLMRSDRLYNGFQFAESGDRIVYNSADGNRPYDLHATTQDFANDVQLVPSNPQLDDMTFGTTELVRYLDVDGDRLNGVVYYPPNYQPGTKYPTVFVVYEQFFDDRFNSTVNVLTNAGYVVMQPSVDLEIGFPGEAWVKGVTAAANTLIERGIADPERMGVHGTSYGGYATNLLVTQTNRFKAAINISGKVDMISFYTDSPRLGVRNIHAPENSQDRIGATLWEQPQKYIDHSAIMFADRIETPLLLMTGEQDHNVPARTTMEMYFALRRLGKTVTWINYVNGGHGMPRTNEIEVRDYYQRILEWYDKYLGEKPESEVTSGF